MGTGEGNTVVGGHIFGRPALPFQMCRARLISRVGGDCVVELVGLELTTKVLWNMVGVRPTTLVGHPRTDHQSVMEHGGVRPAHLVGHPSLRSRQGNPGSKYQAQLPWGISQRGNLQLRPNAWWSWSDTHPDRRAFVFRDYPGGWSDSNEQRNAVLVRSAPPHCHDQFGSLRRRSIDTAIFAPGYL